MAFVITVRGVLIAGFTAGRIRLEKVLLVSSYLHARCLCIPKSSHFEEITGFEAHSIETDCAMAALL